MTYNKHLNDLPFTPAIDLTLAAYPKLGRGGKFIVTFPAREGSQMGLGRTP